MKFFFKNGKMILFLNRFCFKNDDFNDKEGLTSSVKNLLKRVYENYNLEFKGYYDVNMYVDKNYGVVMEIDCVDNFYLDYFGNSLDINLKINDDSFLYEVDDVSINSDYEIYVYGGHIYVMFNRIVPSISMGRILENVNDVLYGLKKDRILKSSQILG